MTLLAVVLSLALLVLHGTSGNIPLAYYALMGLATVIVSAETIVVRQFSRRIQAVVLVELLTTFAISRLEQAYRFPALLGYDTYAHLSTTLSLLDSGHVTATASNSSAFPALHILLAGLVDFGGIDIKAAFVAVSILSGIYLVFLFIIAENLLGARWGAIATIIASSLPFSTWWTLVGISPTTVGIVFAMGTTALLVKGTRQTNLRLRTLAILMAAALVISHPILTLFVVWFLACFIATQHLRRSELQPFVHRFIPLVGITMILAVMMVTYWMYLSQVWTISVTILNNIITSGTGYFPQHPSEALPITTRLWGDLPYVILVATSTLAGLLWIKLYRSENLRAAWTIAGVGIGLAAGYSFVVGQDIGAFANRWLLLLEIIASTLSAGSLLLLLAKRGRLLRVCVTLVIVGALAFVSSTSPYASLFPSDYYPRLAFSSGETSGLEFVRSCSEPVVTDSYSATYLHALYHIPTADLEGFARRLPRNFTTACVAVRTESDVVFTKTSERTERLTVDSADLAPSLARLPEGFLSDLGSQPGMDKVYDDGDTLVFFMSHGG